MAFMDAMKNKLSAAGQTTVQKAKELSELTKLNTTIADCESKIKSLYSKLGYEVYLAYHEKPLLEVEGILHEIKELYQKIEHCKEQITVLNSANTCPNCGNKINKGMVFCSGCGYQLQEKESVVEEQQTIVCSQCGETVLSDALFCAACGNKLNEE